MKLGVTGHSGGLGRLVTVDILTELFHHWRNEVADVVAMLVDQEPMVTISSITLTRTLVRSEPAHGAEAVRPCPPAKAAKPWWRRLF